MATRKTIKAPSVAKQSKGTPLPKLAIAEVHMPTTIEELAELVPVEAPHISVSAIMLHNTGNDFIAVLSHPVPLVQKNGAHSAGAKSSPAAIVYMSPQTAKDVSIVFADAIRKHELKFGTIVTPYTQALEAKAKASHGDDKKRG